MQAIINTYRENGIVVRRSCQFDSMIKRFSLNVQLSRLMISMLVQRATFLLTSLVPMLIYIGWHPSWFKHDIWLNAICSGDSYPQGTNSWAQVQAVYYSNHESSAPSDPLCLAEVCCILLFAHDVGIDIYQFGGGFLLGWGAVARGGTGYEKYCTWHLIDCSQSPDCNLWPANSLTDATYGI